MQIEEGPLHTKAGTMCLVLKRIDVYLIGLGFTKIAENPNLYYLFHKSDLLVLVLYVDAWILAGSS
jgi:hypothetical protein